MNSEQLINALVVEDEICTRQFIKRLAEENGLKVTAVESCEKALQELEKKEFSLILTDWNLPGKSGFELIQEVRKKILIDNLPYIIMITGNNSLDDIDKITRIQLNDFLIKPINPSILWARLQLAIKRIEEARHWNEVTEKSESIHLQNQQILKSLSSLLLIFCVDAEFKIVHINKLSEILLGISSNHFLGKKFIGSDIFWNSKDIDASIHQCISEKIQTRIPEIQYVRPDDSIGILNLTICPYCIDERKSNLGFILLGEDITEMKIMQSKLQDSLKLEAIGQLSAGIAHEINTPTQFIGDNLRFIEQGIEKLKLGIESFKALTSNLEQKLNCDTCLTEDHDLLENLNLDFHLNELPLSVQDAIEGTVQIAEIVKAMKEYSHPGNDKDVEQVDINKVIKNALTLSRNEWKHFVEIELNLEEGMPLVEGFARELAQAFLNLIVNSSHAISDKLKSGDEEFGSISIQSSSNEFEITILFCDSGIGIPEELQRKIFEPFFTTKEVGKGTGQGLTQVFNAVVHQHNGSIDLFSTPSKGTQFVIKIPISRSVELLVNE